MADEALPSQEYLNKALRYDPETGYLYWRHRDDASKHWNSTWAGKRAFTAISSTGYHRGGVDSKQQRAHRVIFKMVHGTEPSSIDHINGIKTDNRIENLRAVDHRTNMRNQRLHSRNKSGVVGVSFTRGRWKAQSADRKKRSLGSFATKEEAVAARRLWEQQQDFHPNHGRMT
jgi:hypothetical protein